MQQQFVVSTITDTTRDAEEVIERILAGSRAHILRKKVLGNH